MVDAHGKNNTRRALVLPALFTLAIGLVLIAWWVSPNNASPPPENAPLPVPNSKLSPADSGEPILDGTKDLSEEQACEIPDEWLQVGGDWTDLISEERIDRFLSTAESAFLDSRNVDELVFAVTLTDASSAAIERFNEEIASGSRSPYLLFKAVDRCSAFLARGYTCPLEEWLELLTILDSENSEVWIRVAGLRFERGDNAAGMTALERAATAAGSSDYYLRDLQSFLNGVEASGETTRYEAAKIAIVMAAYATQPTVNFHAAACTDLDMTDARRLELCELYVENLRSRPVSRALKNISEQISLFTAKARGDTEEVERLERSFETEAERLAADAALQQAKDLFERLNPDLLYDYINDIAFYGESDAESRHLERLQRLGFDAFLKRCNTEIELIR